MFHFHRRKNSTFQIMQSKLKLNFTFMRKIQQAKFKKNPFASSLLLQIWCTITKLKLKKSNVKIYFCLCFGPKNNFFKQLNTIKLSLKSFFIMQRVEGATAGPRATAREPASVGATVGPSTPSYYQTLKTCLFGKYIILLFNLFLLYCGWPTPVLFKV